MDYQVYMGSSMTMRSLRWLPLYLCSYKLVNSATQKAPLPVKDPFYGIMPCMSAYPLRRINLQVTLREGENTRSKFLTFEIADFESAYNYIMGRLFLKKFMAIAHFAYLVLKVPNPHGSMIIHGDCKGVVAYDMKTMDMIRQYA